MVFEHPRSLPIRVILTMRAYRVDEIAFGVQVINDSPDYTVLSASIPSISFVGYEKPELLIAQASGQLFDNASRAVCNKIKCLSDCLIMRFTVCFARTGCGTLTDIEIQAGAAFFIISRKNL